MTKEEFKRLFNEYFDPLRGYIYYRCGDQEMAVDVAQETFMKIWEKQPGLDNIKGLLYKIAGGLFVSKYRKSVSAQNYLKAVRLDFISRTPEDEILYNELKAGYEKALSGMNENQRIVFFMSRVDELKYSEIAERLGVSVKAVEKRMSKALKYLKHELFSEA